MLSLASLQGIGLGARAAVASLFGALPGMPNEPVEVLDDKFGAVRSLPTFGTMALYAVIALAGLGFALALLSAKRPRFLPAARNVAYATCALILFDLLLLAYGFLSHDFRIRYIAKYSDRSMSVGYLFTALWGGQDGSLLWWLFLLSLYSAACVWWLKGKYRELQPYVIATLLATVLGFGVIMAFAANPFSEQVAGGGADGEGLNPLLQNIYMIVHPPSLYVGFVGCTVPFAFGVAALATGRLDEEWLRAVRKWMLFAWTFLSIGNVLGMLWAYEELGWGGYWAWDPVENAAFIPWLTASAFVHSIMIQERFRIVKVWNVVLIAMTFFMTIFGTFLTRAGLIKSVHAFAYSNIGVFFTYVMLAVACGATALIVFRLPELKNVHFDHAPTKKFRDTVGKTLIYVLFAVLAATIFIRRSTPKMGYIGLLGGGAVIGMIVFGQLAFNRAYPKPVVARIDSLMSREAAFVANNWVLVGMQLFILLTTVFPLISELVTGESVTVGPGFYNRWITPLALSLFGLMGVAPLLGWRKTSKALFRKAFIYPLIAMGVFAVLHLAIGKKIGFPAIVDADPIYPGALGTILAKWSSIVPLLLFAMIGFNFAVIEQEFRRGVQARIKAKNEGLLTAFVRLVARSRRRYGGYVVHLGIIFMFLGFLGWTYNVDQEVAMRPGESVEFKGYTITYLKERSETDPNMTKREVYTDLAVKKGGKDLGTVSPAKFIYLRQRMPTSEVAIMRGMKEDLYVSPGQVNPDTKLASFKLHVNPLTSWIWFGAAILLLGAVIAMWPEAALGEVGVSAYLRTAGATAASLALGLMLAITPAMARADGGGSSSMMSGNVTMNTPQEKQLFSQVLCMCGDCDRLPLSECTCGWADKMRATLRARLAAGDAMSVITDEYAKKYGVKSLNVPPSNSWFMRSVWLVPLALVGAGGVFAVFLVRRWTRKDDETNEGGKTAGGAPEDSPEGAEGGRDDYDARLDAELHDDDDRRR
jgi:cytochrome c-type biogenesis protein CcmF